MILNGLKKYTLGCENRADAHGFLWIDNGDNIQQIQLVFGEIVIEWFAGKWAKFSMTNREINVSNDADLPHGAHIMHPLEINTFSRSSRRLSFDSELPCSIMSRITSSPILSS